MFGVSNEVIHCTCHVQGRAFETHTAGCLQRETWRTELEAEMAAERSLQTGPWVISRILRVR